MVITSPKTSLNYIVTRFFYCGPLPSPNQNFWLHQCWVYCYH